MRTFNFTKLHDLTIAPLYTRPSQMGFKTIICQVQKFFEGSVLKSVCLFLNFFCRKFLMSFFGYLFVRSVQVFFKYFFKGCHLPGIDLKFIIVRDTYFHHIK